MNKALMPKNILACILIIVFAVSGTRYVFHWMDSATKSYQEQIKEWKSTSDSLAQINVVLRERTQTLLHENAVKDSAITETKKDIVRMERHAAEARKINDAKLDSLSKNCTGTCETALNLARSYRNEADTLKTALSKAKEALAQRDSQLVASARLIVDLQKQVDDYESHNIKMPEYHEPKFLGILPLPSRTVTFAVGVVVGAGVVLAAQ